MTDKYKRKNLPQNQWRNLLQNARTEAWNSSINEFPLRKHCLLVMRDPDYPARTVFAKGLILEGLASHCTYSMLKISNVSKLTDWVRHLLLVHPRYLIYVTQLINNPQMKPHKYSLYIKSVTMNPVPGFNKARYGWTLIRRTSASITASWCCRCRPRLCYTLANAA